ncbi:MAG TPA: adenylate kinase [Myxococcota bacterium]|nr:adenylate kinase [Myxococcota bacterium]
MIATDPSRLERVVVVGTSGSGKTTFARSLGRVLGVPHVELDALYWGPRWTPAPAEEFLSRVRAAVAEPAWVVDGNYSAARDLVWGRATTLVWLDYPFTLVYPRAVWRTLRRIVTREPLFGGNRESFAITDPEWIPWWVLRTFWRRRREYPRLLARPEFAHLQVLELGRPSEADALLRSLAA